MNRINQNFLLLLIFFAALIVRLAFVLPSSDIPSSDAGDYDRLGISMAEGMGYVNSDGTAHSFRPPLYPLFLSLIYRFFGHSYPAVRIIQSIIGAISCVFIFLIGKRMCSLKVGILSAFISIGYPPFVKSAELLLSELIFTFLLLLIVVYLLKIQESMMPKNCIITGLLLGIALLVRSIALLLPFFIAPIFIYSRKGSLSKGIKSFMIVLLFFGLVISPWVIRNYMIYHKFTPITTQGGIAFYSSYCPRGDVYGLLARSEDPIVREADKISCPVERSNFLTKKTSLFILNNPGKLLAIELEKILFLWAPFDWEIVGGRWFNFIYAAMLPFFALGLLLAFKKLKRFYPILAPIIYVQIMSLIFFGSPRFRLPIEPYLIILSMCGVVEIWRFILRKRGSNYEDICGNTCF